MDEVEELRAEVERLRAARLDPTVQAIAESSTDNIMLLDVEGRIQYINWTVPDLTPQTVVGTPVTNYVPETFRSNITRCLERVRETKRPDRYETHYVAENGDVSYWESRVAPVLRGGRLAGFTVISSNVSERRKAAADRDRFFNLSIDILATADETRHLTRINPAFERTVGFSEEELLARPFMDFIHPDDCEATALVVNRLFEGEALIDFENRYRHKDGTYRTISWRAIADPDRRVIYGVGRDVTDQKILEAQGRQLQKMDALGQLAGGVAHDFNNLILAIQGNALLAKRNADSEATREHLGQIEQAASRAAALTRQLLTFSRRQPMHAVSLDVNALTGDLVKLLDRLIPASIEIQVIAAREGAPVRADVGQLEQVIMNLCLNARDAMPEGGKLTIETQNVLVDRRFRETYPWVKPGRYVLLSVTDTGMGMTREVRDRIFEPFFTTKEAGRGTGLGLSTVYGIVQEHGGMVHVESLVGKGTTFRVYLPAVERVVGSREDIEAEAVGGNESILVAEDEQLVRRVVVKTLESAGYTVYTARDGIEAVAAFKKHRDEIALALLDVVMPKSSGLVAYEEIRAQNPELPVIFTSGYHDEYENKSVAWGDLLEKPYTPEELLRRVRRALDER